MMSDTSMSDDGELCVCVECNSEAKQVGKHRARYINVSASESCCNVDFARDKYYGCIWLCGSCVRGFARKEFQQWLDTCSTDIALYNKENSEFWKAMQKHAIRCVHVGRNKKECQC